MLTINNKTDDIEIDWNKTYYYNYKNNLGDFVFKDITPSDIKEGIVPNDIIQPDIQFSKRTVHYPRSPWLREKILMPRIMTKAFIQDFCLMVRIVLFYCYKKEKK